MRVLKCLTALILSAVFLTVLPAPTTSAQERHQTVGLVLSGGGAKGIAHIGVIKALEENNIPIDYITGTSMGAIVGGLYACGYTTDEMMELLMSKDFSYWSTGKIDPELSYFFTKPDASPGMYTYTLPPRDSLAKANAPVASLISPMPMAFGFMELFSSISAQCDGNFDNLYVPYRCVTSNMTDRRKMVLSGGNLGDAIRSSMSFPIVFQPISIDGKLCYDGGIYDNFPVDVMRSEFAPSVMIGVDVSTPSSGPPTSFMDQLDLLVVQNSDYSLPSDEGIRLHIDLHEFGLLDFPKAPQISRIGYNHAMKMMDSIKSRIAIRANPVARDIAREVFKSRTPYLRFGKVEVTGGTKAQNEYISYLFAPKHDSDSIGLEKTRLAYYKALSSGQIGGFQVKATRNDSTGLFDLSLKTSIKQGLNASFGGYITSANNSFLYLRGGFSSLSFRSVSTDLQAWIGQSYMAGALSGKIYLHSAIPSAFAFEAVVSRRKYYESEHLFFKVSEPLFIVGHELFGKVKWSTAAGRTGRFDLGVGGGRVANSFYGNDAADDGSRSRIKFNLGQAFATYLSSTINDPNFPTSGFYRRASASAVLGKYHFRENSTGNDKGHNTKWLTLDMRLRHYLDLGRHWSVGIDGAAILSTRKLPDNYYAAISSAPGYHPTPASDNIFNTSFHANSFIAAGLTPVYKFNDNLSARITGHVFVPLRKICDDGSKAVYGKWFGSVAAFGELDIVYQLPFASLSAYCNYATGTNVNAGISFGIYIPAPSFLH